MEYSIKSFSTSKERGSTNIKQTNVEFGTTPESSKVLASPAELFLSSFSACIIKNVERFSKLMNFEYSKAKIAVVAIRIEKPPRMDEIEYVLKVYSLDNKFKINLLKKNIEKFGTIFNTVKSSCSIKGEIEKINDEKWKTSIIFLLLALIAEIVGTVGGFGSSVFFVPIGNFYFDFHSVLGLTAIFHLSSNLSKIFLFKKGLDKKLLINIGIPSVVFVIVGGFLSKLINSDF